MLVPYNTHHMQTQFIYCLIYKKLCLPHCLRTHSKAAPTLPPPPPTSTDIHMRVRIWQNFSKKLKVKERSWAEVRKRKRKHKQIVIKFLVWIFSLNSNNLVFHFFRHCCRCVVAILYSICNWSRQLPWQCYRSENLTQKCELISHSKWFW